MYFSDYASHVMYSMNTVSTSSALDLGKDLLTAWKNRAYVFTCGNGGSASNASHLAQDLAYGTLVEAGKNRLKVMALTDSVSTITKWANDEGYESIFSQQVRTWGRPGDLLIAISGSGNSKNVLGAVQMANALGMRTWGITGFDGGELKGLATRTVQVHSFNMGMVEAVHSVLFHWLVSYLKPAMAAYRAGFREA